MDALASGLDRVRVIAPYARRDAQVVPVACLQVWSTIAQQVPHRHCITRLPQVAKRASHASIAQLVPLRRLESITCTEGKAVHHSGGASRPGTAPPASGLT